MTKAYDTDGEGRWWVTEWQPQCPEKLILSRGCQGTAGHAGDHWSYTENGSYEWCRTGAGGGWTPPGHAHWVSPVDKHPDHYRKFRTTTEVTDLDLISRLEAGEVGDASITKPCTDEEIEELRQMGRLDDLDDEFGTT